MKLLFENWRRFLLNESISPAVEAEENSNKITAYHCGWKSPGTEWSHLSYGSGEGMAALGPGIYFSDVKGLAELYCKYSQLPYIYDVELDMSGIYDFINGTPKELKENLKELVNEKNLSAWLGRRLEHGPGNVGRIFKRYGSEKGREILKKIGITGLVEKLPSGALEIAVYDLQIIKTISYEKRFDKSVEDRIKQREKQEKVYAYLYSDDRVEVDLATTDEEAQETIKDDNKAAKKYGWAVIVAYRIVGDIRDVGHDAEEVGPKDRWTYLEEPNETSI